MTGSRALGDFDWETLVPAKPTDKLCLWEIFVPTTRNNGRPIHLRFHRVWDEKVRAITGGLTIMPVAMGQWEHQDQLYKERMIPVRIAATRDQMEEIVDLTLDYYDQIKVMAYRLSDEVILRGRKGTA
jgi:hypothetical protein